jgi:hypothetical protein
MFFLKITCPTSAPLQVRHWPYPSRYLFRLPFGWRLSLLGTILCPLESSTLVTFGLPGNEGIFRTLSGFPRSARGGDVIALGLLSTPGARCSQSIFRRYRPSGAPAYSCQPFRVPKLTKPLQGFICIILSNLVLACTLDLAPKVLRHFTSSADTTLPLLVEYSEADIRLNTGGERLLGISPTPPNDFESRG